MCTRRRVRRSPFPRAVSRAANRALFPPYHIRRRQNTIWLAYDQITTGKAPTSPPPPRRFNLSPLPPSIGRAGGSGDRRTVPNPRRLPLPKRRRTVPSPNSVLQAPQLRRRQRAVKGARRRLRPPQEAAHRHRKGGLPPHDVLTGRDDGESDGRGCGFRVGTRNVTTRAGFPLTPSHITASMSVI